MRESIRIQIPEQYKENERLGLCKLCGKPKSEFSKGMKKYCSDECYWKYQDECFLTWNKLRKQVLIEAKCVCVLCGGKATEVDHILAIVNGGDMWDKNNLRALCHTCHVKKTTQDVRLKNKDVYKVQMQLCTGNSAYQNTKGEEK